ncbi:Uncharacterized conserved protein, contains ParB-like and HNH nuclease domains [Haladaptatus litoreus]|uniref:Uncharacterized conserved protein, contains ParB-like and HNH nuclease domains n=1 Tax=Haladaptatus litoreus TaxID=553468 RepID=A0A1N7EJQ3_9EURY|nr:DUF262 domain-containing protein [Haladaptatus litoreus]SIR88249.1 Uncharacterized conserved protein, contains ParB-like and HNH nuclease domains [Haladaptatus litoreus]
MQIAEQIRPKEMGDLFSQNERLKIPSYQRRYSWEKEQFEDLWRDLNKTGSEGGHFFGTIVFMSNIHVAQGTNEIDIVDGQQRITTVSILLCAIRDHLREFYDEDDTNQRVETIEEALWIVNRDGEKQGMRLTLGNLDHDSYENLVNGYVNEVENEKIELAYKFFQERLDTECRNLSEVKELHDRILDQLIYVSITAKGHSEAYQLFETMNNRGLSLSPIDLMKNYLLMKASKRGDTSENRVEDLWGDIIQNIDSLSDIHDSGETFFRQYFMSSHLLGINQKITKSKLYDPTFTDTIDESENVEELLEDIREKSALFRRLLQQDISRFSDSENSEINRLLRDAEIVSITPFTLFLRAFSESDDVDLLKEIIRRSNALLIRRQICDRNTGPHDTIFNHLAQNAFESDNPIQYIVDYLESEGRFPNDDQFRRHFVQEDFSRTDRTKYILSKIEEIHFGHGGKEVVESRYRVHIEHILPERPGKNLTKLWLEPFGITEDEHDDFKKRIGNLTLLEDDPNISASNRSLKKKQEYYTENATDFKMTHELEDQDQWGISEIEARSERLAQIAAEEVWIL